MSCSSNEFVQNNTETNNEDSVYPAHEPFGEGIGINPGEVVWGFDPNAVAWDGTGYWWNESNFNSEIIHNLLEKSLLELTNQDNAENAWDELFKYYNQNHGINNGYQQGQKLAIKVNINGSGVSDNDNSGNTNLSYTNPYLLKELLLSLVKDARVNPKDITVYDVSRLFPEYMIDLCTKDQLKGIQFVDRSNAQRDENVKLTFSNNFETVDSYLPTCVTQANYLINLANLKGHSFGITLTAKNHFGSFLNSSELRPPLEANLHQWLTRKEMNIYSPLVDLIANMELGGKTILYILDALIVASSEGIEMTKENTTWKMEPFNENFTCSIFLSQDPLAIDSVGADFLAAEPTVYEYNSEVRDSSNENYLHEGGMVSDAPSGIKYKNQNGIVKNLGIHEHWNNIQEKKYSGNFNKKGILLKQILLKKNNSN